MNSVATFCTPSPVDGIRQSVLIDDVHYFRRLGSLLYKSLARLLNSDYSLLQLNNTRNLSTSNGKSDPHI